jgi:hypothetical protein
LSPIGRAGRPSFQVPPRPVSQQDKQSGRSAVVPGRCLPAPSRASSC